MFFRNSTSSKPFKINNKYKFEDTDKCLHGVFQAGEQGCVEIVGNVTTKTVKITKNYLKYYNFFT